MSRTHPLPELKRAELITTATSFCDEFASFDSYSRDTFREIRPVRNVAAAICWIPIKVGTPVL